VVRGQRHASPAFYPRKDPVPIVQETAWAPGPIWTGAENLAPQPGFDPRTVQPVASRYTRPIGYFMCPYSCLIYPTGKMHLLCAPQCCHLWPVWMCHILPHYLINVTIYEGKNLEPENCALLFSTTLVWKFYHLRRIQRYIVINVFRYSCKVPVIFIRFKRYLNFVDSFQTKSPRTWIFINIHQVGAVLFHVAIQTNKRTDRRDETNSRFLHILQKAPKYICL
jgi:hypothetical protein